MKRHQFGFTLIELLIVIAVIGILAAIALPWYRGYAIRAKLTEVENSMAVVGTALTAYWAENGAWVDCTSVIGVRNTLGVSMAAVGRISGISITNGVVTATVDNIDPLVDNKTLSLIPTLGGDGSIQWSWGWSIDFPAQFRPKS